MVMKTTNPAARRAGRAVMVDAIGDAFDNPHTTFLPDACLATRHIAERYRLPPTRARLVAELAGLGVRHA